MANQLIYSNDLTPVTTLDSYKGVFRILGLSEDCKPALLTPESISNIFVLYSDSLYRQEDVISTVKDFITKVSGKGIQGIQGTQGPQGPKGKPGIGHPGPQGVQGPDGLQGEI